jgi:hypothetical protein
MMLERVHDHIISELQQNARTDTVFVVTAVVFNLLLLAINSALAGGGSLSADLIFVLFTIVSVIINALAISALLLGKGTRNKLLSGLLAMYRDNDVNRYYDETLLTSYDKRYGFFTGIILCLAVLAVVIPLIIRAS